jgi:hypothetical protein
MCRPRVVALRPNLTDFDVSSYRPFMKCFRQCAAAAVVGLAAASLLAGCRQPAAEQAAPAETPYRPVASIREVMNSVIDPSIDIVWNSVATVIDDGKMTERAPSTDEEWAEVRRHALIVSEAANLLLMPSRPVAPPGAGSSAPGVELDPQEVEKLITENRDGWNVFVQDFQESMKTALGAIDAKNTEALLDAGEKIDTTCENCHQTFWFPNAVASAR